MSGLVCRGLARRPWFEGVDLELSPGEIVVLSGPSGSGKSLLLRSIADLDPIDEGTLELDGEDRERVAPELWRSRVLFVHPGGVALAGTVGDELDRVARLAIHRGGARYPDLGLRRDADTERLSGGEGAWLALTRAFGIGPRVLLLDETTAPLDPDSARRAEAGVRAFADGGRAVLWVSHDPSLAGRIGARPLPWKKLTG